MHSWVIWCAFVSVTIILSVVAALMWRHASRKPARNRQRMNKLFDVLVQPSEVAELNTLRASVTPSRVVHDEVEFDIVVSLWLNPEFPEATLEQEYMDIWHSMRISHRLHLVITGCPLRMKTFQLPMHYESVRYIVGNHYEYYGILRVWEVSQGGAKYIGYWHNKSSSYRPNMSPRMELLLRRTFQPWSEVQTILGQYPVCGYVPSVEGHVWYNFWWTTGQHVQTVGEPELTKDRFYYEWWLGNGDAAYSLHSHTVRGFTAHEARRIMGC